MREIKNVKESLEIFFLQDGRPGWRTLLLHKPLFRWIRKRVESIEDMTTLRSSPGGAKESWS